MDNYDEPDVTIAQPTAAPTRKLTAATIGGAAATLVVAGIGMAGVDVPPGVEGALAVLLAFAAGYVVYDRPNV